MLRCPKCGSSAIIKGGCQSSGKPRFECKYCKATFQAEYKQQNHNVKCVICGEKAYKNSTLKDGRVTYKCSKCKKCFIDGEVKRTYRIDDKIKKQVQIYSRVKGLTCRNIGEAFGISTATVSRIQQTLKEVS